MIQVVSNSFRLPDVRRRILFTLGILIVVRFASHIPAPGADYEGLRRFFQIHEFLGWFDLLLGGALETFSIMALGIHPYITASLVIQLLVPIIPHLEELTKAGKVGYNKINRYTYLLTIPLAALQSLALSPLYKEGGILCPSDLLERSSGVTLLPTFATMATLAAGTMFTLWLSELINRYGIGNGVLIIILANILAKLPQKLAQLLISGNVTVVIFWVILYVIIIFVIVFVQKARRLIPVQYGKRVLGLEERRLYITGGRATHVPLQVLMTGTIPVTFALSILNFPNCIAAYFMMCFSGRIYRIASWVYATFKPSGAFYWILYFLMIVGFTYLFTDIISYPQNLAEGLKQAGGFIPGIRPGKRTAEYLSSVLRRITMVGAIFLATLAVMPFLIRGLTGVSGLLITSTGLFIVVNGLLDMMRQFEKRLLKRHYEGFIR